MKLQFGFEAVPYATYQPPGPTRKGRMRHPKYGAVKDSQQVAEKLEEKYHIVEAFFTMEEDYIISLIEDAFLEDVEAVLGMQKPKRKGISTQDTDQIASRFRRAIAYRRFDGVIPGVPTQAALKGVSHLRVKPYAARGSRPSFRDTGNYVNSFRVWTE